MLETNKQIPYILLDEACQSKFQELKRKSKWQAGRSYKVQWLQIYTLHAKTTGDNIIS